MNCGIALKNGQLTRGSSKLEKKSRIHSIQGNWKTRSRVWPTRLNSATWPKKWFPVRPLQLQYQMLASRDSLGFCVATSQKSRHWSAAIAKRRKNRGSLNAGDIRHVIRIWTPSLKLATVPCGSLVSTSSAPQINQLRSLSQKALGQVHPTFFSLRGLYMKRARVCSGKFMSKLPPKASVIS